MAPIEIASAPRQHLKPPRYAASTEPLTLKDVEELIWKLIDEKTANASAPENELNNQLRFMGMVSRMIGSGFRRSSTRYQGQSGG
ncbi:hypothetical protein BDDG_11531 [Blastomyces dermatitidis ATCC 18188]|uniref:Uncharacterized protein n=1 Tax=Ajellomyces dermatitidis (strain ATCC 18188 / CBS 674.68) TaxID=653446 RepID=A0A0J9HBK0_AJEDA|nr:hypothetical protein BDDG_11531 [Blastomyces dermatitidis ATCC 18188]